MLGKYILVDHVPVREPDTIKWAEWMEDISKRRVDETLLEGYRISTVFLGLDHGFGPSWKAPLIFETMVFGSSYDGEYQERCCTWEEALTQHQEAIKWVLDKLTEVDTKPNATNPSNE